jgi:hypothetical protein
VALLVFIWILLSTILLGVVIRRGQRGGVLLLAYYVGLSIIHVPGVLDYLGDAPGLNQERETYLGFVATLISLGALLIGAMFAKTTVEVRGGNVPPGARGQFRRNSVAMIVAGAGIYFLVVPLTVLIPSATAVLASVGSLLPFGFWLYFYSAIQDRSLWRLLLGLAMLPLLPMSTMISGGFISNGMYWVIAVVALIYVASPWKRYFALLAPLAFILGLSAAIAYFGGRSELRDAVWYEQAPVSARIGRIMQMFDNFELVDFNNPTHVQYLDSRLNQNYFVGLTIMRHEDGEFDLALGGTVPWWALVPRALWPDKPQVGGGRSIVSDFTGLTLSEGTSFGAGQPLEFYANFGWPGIIGGFCFFGYVLMRLDMVMNVAFKQSDMARLIRVALPSLSLLQPGGNLLEILVAVAAAMVAARIVLALLRHYGVITVYPSSRPLARRRVTGHDPP